MLQTILANPATAYLATVVSVLILVGVVVLLIKNTGETDAED